MKKLIVILFFIIGLFLLIVTNTSWLSFGQSEKEVNVTDEIDLIEIDVSGVSTTIIPDDRNHVSTEYTGNGKVSIEENGDTISIDFEAKHFFNVFSWFKKNHLTIYLPEDYDRDLDINSGSGSLRFSGQSKNNPMKLENLSLDMSSGNVQLRNLSATHFEQDGSSGNVSIDSLSTKTGSFNMSSGNMDVKEYSGKVEAELSSGRLTLGMKNVTDTIGLDVKSGFATLDLPSDADFSLSGEIGSGAITTDFNLTNSKKDEHNLVGVHGSGKHAIELKVNSGKIEIK